MKCPYFYTCSFSIGFLFFGQKISQKLWMGEAEHPQDMADDKDGVRLSTIHQSKGLEYAVVFIIGVSDGLLPHTYSLNSIEENAIEENGLKLST